MARPVIITGPAGCGKTLHASTLAAHLGCNHVVDGWVLGDALTPGALHLTNEPMERLALGAMGLGEVLREFADVALSCGLVAEGAGVVACDPPAVIETPVTPPRRARKGA